MFENRESYALRMDIFEKIIEEKTQRQNTILQELDDLSQGNKGFVIGATYILELCSRAVELFEAETTTLEQKRYIVETVLSNVQLTDKKLSFTINDPFNAIVKAKEKAPEGAETANWCALSYEIKTLLLRHYQKMLEN